MRKPLSRLSLILAAVALPWAGLANAQEALEEVIVTATKRAESLQDVPMSVQSYSGEALASLSIDDIRDMSIYVPNFSMGDGLTVSEVTMRGLGAGVDRGFETPVSTFRDGVYMSRGRQTRSPFFDMERVEVVRGPQAVLFGLNSTAGAISLISATNQPGDELEANLTGEIESEYSGFRGGIVVGGSLGDTVGARFAYEHYDSGDGWLDNPISGDAGAQDHDVARLSLVWQPNDKATFTARYEYSEMSVDGQTTSIAAGDINLPGYGAAGGLLQRVGIANSIIPGSFDLAGEMGSPGYLSYASDDQTLHGLHSIIDRKPYRDTSGADQEMDAFSLNLDYDLGNYLFTGTFGYTDYFYDMAVNVTGLNDPMWFATNYEEHDQKSIDLRISSQTDGPLEWFAGVYYHKATLFTDQPNTIDVGRFFGLFLGLPPAIVDAVVLGAPIYELTTSSLDQDTKLLSPYVSFTWKIDDTLRLTAGLRYSDEEKDYLRDGSANGSGLFLKLGQGQLGPFLGGALVGATGAAIGPRRGTLSSSNAMPELALEYDISDDIMFFARFAQSAKSGGIATAGSTDLEGLFYDDETAESIEFGLKGRFLDGRAEVNATVFATDYEDLQVKSSIVTASGVLTVIDNAGFASSEGIEIDARFAANDFMIVGGNIGWLNAKYDDYSAGPCNNSASTPISSTPGACDLSGFALPYAPDYSGSVYLDIDKEIANGMRFIGNLTIAFSDEYFVDGTLDPSIQQGSWQKVAMRAGIAAADNSWEVALVGKNLTDETVWISGQPLFGYSMVYMSPPRTLALQGRYSF